MIKNLKNSHAYGRDKIDAATMKMAVKFLLEPITHVINLSLTGKVFAQKWKLARILPLLKGKDQDCTNPASFRPVSQLPLIGKLTERAVQSQLLEFLERNELIGQRQHAYRAKTSTTTALLEVTDLIGTGADENKVMGTIVYRPIVCF